MSSAEEIAGEIANLISQLEEQSPDLSGDISVMNEDVGDTTVAWSLQIEEGNPVVVIDLKSDVLYFGLEDLELMAKAVSFFEGFSPSKRKMIMSVLEYDEEE